LKNEIPAISFAIFVPAMVAIGAYFGTVIIPLLFIGAIIAITVLVALNKISGWQLYLYLFGIALGLVWQTTMLGVDVVGSDIHIEYYYAQLSAQQPWNPGVLDASNTSIVIGLIAPWISKIFRLDMVWVFKVILPIFLACVPLVLFAAFKKMFGEKRAFFAAMFFMIMPSFSMEITQIAKSMVAELFFALMVYAMVTDWRWQYKLAGIGGALVMQILCHYTIGIIGILFLLGVLIFRLTTSKIKWDFWGNKKVPLFVLVIVLVMAAGIFGAYYTYMAEGLVLKGIQGITSAYLPSTVPQTPTISPSGIAAVAPIVLTDKLNISVQRWAESSSLLRLGMGLDFLKVSISGKIFRLVQLLTEALIIVGIARFIYAYRQYKASAEFIGLVASSGVLMLACILIAGFDRIANMSRFYHLSLFFLAPIFVLGCEALGPLYSKSAYFIKNL
jgi:uncharacterized membrane protein